MTTDALNDAFEVLRTLLDDAGYQTARVDGREGILGENAARVVWAVAFPAVTDLLEQWEEEQAWLVDFADGRLSQEKTWELYLVLACAPMPDSAESAALEGIRRDASYARKLVVPGISDLSLGRVNDYLAPLKELELPTDLQRIEALVYLEGLARDEDYQEAIRVLEAYRAGRPLLESV